jgi:hypothetical protein
MGRPTLETSLATHKKEMDAPAGLFPFNSPCIHTLLLS